MVQYKFTLVSVAALALILLSSLSQAQDATVRAVEPLDVIEELSTSQGGLTADEAAQRAIRVAPLVHSADAARVQAEDAAVMGGVAFMPRFDLQASYTRLSEMDQPPLTFGTTVIDDAFPQILDNYGLRGTMTVPLTDYFLTVLPTYQAGRKAADVARHQGLAEREATALRARETFYGHVRARAAELISKDAVRLLEDHIRNLEEFVEVGQATRADLMQAQAQLADARVQLARSEGLVRVTDYALRRLLDMDSNEEIHIGEDVFHGLPEVAPATDELIQAALQNRPDVRALQALVLTHEAAIRAQQGTRYPSLALVGNVDYANPNPRAFPQNDEFQTSWDVSIILSWSLNDTITRSIQVDQARLEATRTQANLAVLEDQIAVQASQASNDFQVALQTIESTRQGVEASREAWRVRRDLLGAGEATPNDVLDAETSLRRAQFAQVDAYIAARIAYAQVQYVVGQSNTQP
jgi:outer membrane protein TolC